jgi:surface polysaccharide O-acyltransferase-like enzyme
MTKTRNHALDIAKILAAFGVVTLHVKYGTPAGGVFNEVAWPTCVPFFYVASLVFFFKRLPIDSPTDVLSKQLSRVVVPYLVWTVIYLALLFGKAWLVHKPRSLDMVGNFLYGESSVQLYFLPTLLCYQLIAWSVFQFGDREKPTGKTRWVALGAIILGIGYLINGDVQNRFGCRDTGNFIAAALFVGVAYAWTKKPENRYNLASGLVGAAIWIGAVSLNMLGVRLDVLGYPLVLSLGGIGFFMFASSIHIHIKNEWITKALTASFGIYLIHVILLEGFEFLVEVFAKGNLYYSFWVKFGVTFTVFLGAWAITLLLRRNRIARSLFLGES